MLRMPSSSSSSCPLPRHVLCKGQPYEMAFRALPEGRFRRGARGEYSDEEPRQWVKMSRPFWMAETPVTQGQYRFMAEQCGERLQQIEGQEGADPSYFKSKPDGHPVERVGWQEARLMGVWLSEQASLLPAGVEARLPTEAEWEYACRAGTDTDYFNGDGAAALSHAGWYGANADGSTQPVRSPTKCANAFGLWDMHGNVDEWCLDAWNAGAYAERGVVAVDPIDVGGRDARRVLRGGSWILTAGNCRSAFRTRDHPGLRYWSRGFRLCLSSGPVKNQQASVGPEDAEARDPAESASGGAGASDRVSGLDGLNAPEKPRGEVL